MLTSFFGNSRPSVLVLCFLLMLLWLFGLNLDYLSSGLNFWNYIELPGIVLALLLCLLLTNFIVAKNNLSAPHSYAVLSFSVFTALLPGILTQGSIAFTAFFMMLAIRRIFSFQTEKNTEKKVLDASIWVAVASLFDASCLLLIVPLYWAMSRRGHMLFRHFTIPIIGLASVALITSAVLLINGSAATWWNQWSTLPILEWKRYLTHPAMVLLSSAALVLLIGLVLRYKAYSKVNRKDKPNYNLLTVVLGTLLIICLLHDEAGGASWFLMVPFLAILHGNTLNSIKRSGVREAILWIMLALPLLELWSVFGMVR